MSLFSSHCSQSSNIKQWTKHGEEKIGARWWRLTAKLSFCNNNNNKSHAPSKHWEKRHEDPFHFFFSLASQARKMKLKTHDVLDCFNGRHAKREAFICGHLCNVLYWFWFSTIYETDHILLSLEHWLHCVLFSFAHNPLHARANCWLFTNYAMSMRVWKE